MLAGKTLQRHALKSNDIVSGLATLLPFLYCTPSIRRSYIPGRGDAKFDERRDVLAKKSYRPHDKLRKVRSGGYDERKPRVKEQEQERLRGAGRAKVQEAYPPAYIPFERTAAKEDPYADLEGSTITPSEKKAFDALFKLQKKEPSTPEADTTIDSQTGSQSQDSDKATTLDAILAAAVPSSASIELTTTTADAKFDATGRIVPQLPKVLESARQRWLQRRDQRRLKDATGEREEKPETQAQEIEKAAKKELHSVRQAMKKAQTDVEVWQILFKRVVERVLALGLDPPLKGAGEDKKRKEQSIHTAGPLEEDGKHDAEAPARQVGRGELRGPEPDDAKKPTELQLLTLTFPDHLVYTASHLTQNFPSSSLALALLPTIRDLGPTTAALGLSTQLYNTHLNLLWTHYSDLPALVSTLEEMDKGVYDFDHATFAQLRVILAWSTQARRGAFGPSVQVLWRMERCERGVRELRRWLEVVKQRREEAALRRAREVEGIGVGRSAVVEEEPVRFMLSTHRGGEPEDMEGYEATAEALASENSNTA